jgi:hypothetical protein
VRRDLVVLRAGGRSLHRGWLGEERAWDLAISSFDSDQASDFPEAEHFDFYKGGKWDGIFRFFQLHPDLLDRYDYVWLPDDDIETTSADIDRMFALCRGYGLELAQPALTPDSYFWHPVTLQCPLTRLRYTNFVEVMVSVLAADVLRRALPYFEHTKSGWGIDYMWSRLTSDPRRKCAILDEITVRHTRPVGSVLAKSMAAQGQSGTREQKSLSTTADVVSAKAVCFEAVTRSGAALKGQFGCGVLQFLGQAPWLSRGRHRHLGPRVFLASLYSHLRFRPDLTRLGGEQAGGL